jgi:hypothetical protein
VALKENRRGVERMMEFILIQAGATTVAEAVSNDICLRDAGDALDIMVACGARTLLMYERQINPDFFRLPTGLAGEVLQKFTNYRMRLAIVGDFDKYMTKNFADFVRESNKNGQFLFTATKEDAVRRFTKATE